MKHSNFYTLKKFQPPNQEGKNYDDQELQLLTNLLVGFEFGQ